MAFQFPWTNFHELNLDWFLSKFKQFANNYLGTTATVELIPSNEQPEVTVTGGTLDDDTDIVDPFTFNFKLPINSSGGGAVDSVNGQTGTVVLDKSDIGLGNVANVAQYSASNPPPYPVTSVNGQTGAVTVSGGAIDSVNGKTGTVILYGTDIAMASGDATTVKSAIEAKPDNLTDLGVTATATELNYTDGVTSSIQDQIDTKANSTDLSSYLPLAGGTMTGALDVNNKDVSITATGNTNVNYVISNTDREVRYALNGSTNECGLWDATNNSWIIKSDLNTDVSIPHPLTITTASYTNNSNLAASTAFVKHFVQYQPNDTVVLNNETFTGFLTSSSKSIQFFIPLPKDLSNISSASLSVDSSWEVRHTSGGYLISAGNSLASFGTVNYSICATGVRVTVDASTSTSFTNNTPLAVRAITATLILT